MNRTLRLLIIMAMSFSTIMWSCNTSKAVKGGAIGAAAGGVLGAVIGDHFENTAAGAIVGAAVGGTAGALIGRQMDKQAEELEGELEGATVERVGEGILVTFDSGLMFGTNESGLNSATKSNLDELAGTLEKYPDTDILIEGHTDSSGKEEYNQSLSEKRAKTVKDYLIAKGVKAERLVTHGYGELKPVADNTTSEGMKKNRRVELAISANEEMKAAAENGTLD